MKKTPTNMYINTAGGVNRPSSDILTMVPTTTAIISMAYKALSTMATVSCVCDLNFKQMKMKIIVGPYVTIKETITEVLNTVLIADCIANRTVDGPRTDDANKII